MNDNPWAPWGLICTRRDGYPALTDSSLWHLLRAHPETVEREDDVLYVHLDRSYRAIRLNGIRVLEPAPGRKPPARPAATPPAGT